MGNSPSRTCQPMSPVTAWSESRRGVRRWRPRTRTTRPVSAQKRPSRPATLIDGGRRHSSAGQPEAEDRREVGPEVGEEAGLGLAALPEPVDGRDLEDPAPLADGLVEEANRVVAVAVEDRGRVEAVEEGAAEDQVARQVVVDVEAEDHPGQDVEGVGGPVAEARGEHP